jgi:hypothetical protein
MKYLTLIKSIALLHQYQREIKRIERNGQVLEYIEVEPSDIELANELAHEVLGRTLDELPPQTRKLLSLVYDWVTQQCESEKIKQRDFRFSRRQVRDMSGWTDFQIKKHMTRLQEMEYLLAHRGGRGQSFEYELLYCGEGDQDKSFILGLSEWQNLTSGGKFEPLKSEKKPSSSPQVAAKKPLSSPTQKPLQASDTVDLEELIAKSVEKDLLEKNKKVPSSDSLPLMVMS